jgi:hypothetical protein
MSTLEQALTDYLRLRHSLGHELAEAAWLLPGFVAYLDAHGSSTVTIEAALAWAQQANTDGRVTTVGPRRMTAARGFARYLADIDTVMTLARCSIVSIVAGGDLRHLDRTAGGQRVADRRGDQARPRRR